MQAAATPEASGAQKAQLPLSGMPAGHLRPFGGGHPGLSPDGVGPDYGGAEFSRQAEYGPVPVGEHQDGRVRLGRYRGPGELYESALCGADVYRWLPGLHGGGDKDHHPGGAAGNGGLHAAGQGGVGGAAASVCAGGGV